MFRLLKVSVSWISLSLWVAVMALWVRGGFVSDRVTWMRRDEETALDDQISAQFGNGTIDALIHTIKIVEPVTRTSRNDRTLQHGWGRVAPTGVRRWLGTTFRIRSHSRVSQQHLNTVGQARLRWRLTIIILPYWVIAAPLSVAPALHWGVPWLRRRRRRRRGLCLLCGYDLRASSGRCPECGTESPASRQECARTGTDTLAGPTGR